jgi:hypothetical protein
MKGSEIAKKIAKRGKGINNLGYVRSPLLEPPEILELPELNPVLMFVYVRLKVPTPPHIFGFWRSTNSGAKPSRNKKAWEDMRKAKNGRCRGKGQF